jgi:hypothetical protein
VNSDHSAIIYNGKMLIFGKMCEEANPNLNIIHQEEEDMQVEETERIME